MPDPELVQVFRLAQLSPASSFRVHCNALDAVGYFPQAGSCRQRVKTACACPVAGSGAYPLSWISCTRAKTPPKGLPDFRTISFHRQGRFRAQMRAYRIQWLDHLIKEFSWRSPNA